MSSYFVLHTRYTYCQYTGLEIHYKRLAFDNLNANPAEVQGSYWTVDRTDGVVGCGRV